MLLGFFSDLIAIVANMSLNKVKKSIKSKAINGEFKKKIASLQVKLRKIKAEKLAVIEEWQETTDVFEKVEKGLKLEIANGKKKLKEVVTRHNNTIFEKLKENIECPVSMEIPGSGPMFVQMVILFVRSVKQVPVQPVGLTWEMANLSWLSQLLKILTTSAGLLSVKNYLLWINLKIMRKSANTGL